MVKAAIFGNPYKKASAMAVAGLISALKQRGAEVKAEEKFFGFFRQFVPEATAVDGTFRAEAVEADFAFSVGGDGTFLTTAMHICRKGIPIVGVNTGRLGFLTDIKASEIDETIEAILTGDYTLEERTLLEVKTDAPTFADYPYALNEVAVSKQDSASMLAIHVALRGEYLNTYQADGLVMATPTGSTAYSMSVGGPIVAPQAGGVVLSPVAPHSLNIRPLVIPDTWEINLQTESRSHTYLVSIDGRSHVMDHRYTLTVGKANFGIKVVKRHKNAFFDALREKLMWGSDKRKDLD